MTHLQPVVHPCNRVEKLTNDCWKHNLTSFRLEAVDWTVISCVEWKTAGWWDLLLCSKFNCYLDLGSEENVSVPCRLDWQAFVCLFVCLLLCLPLQATHCQLSVITFFSLELSNWFTELSCHSNLFFSPEFVASAASLKMGTCRKPCLFPIWWSYIRFPLTLHTQLHWYHRP